MIRFRILCFSVFVFQLSCDARSGVDEASTVYVARLGDEKAVLKNALGYNPRNYMLQEPYTQAHDPDIQPALVESKASCIRYPGGTFANYWDYANDRMFPSVSTQNAGGWVVPDKVSSDPHDKIRKRIEKGLGAKKGILVNSVEDLKYAAKGGESGQKLNIVFHMNMVTPGRDFYQSEQGWNRAVNDRVGSSDWHAMLDDRFVRFKGMLMRVKSGPDAIPIRFIELGNEYYFSISYVEEAFPDGAAYGGACNYIARKLRADKDLDLSDDLHIAAVASCISGKEHRRSEWNRSLVSTLDRDEVGFVTMHSYEAYVEPPDFAEKAFQEKLVDWYEMVDRKFKRSDADTCFIRASKPWGIWYTENNANWEGSFEGDPSGKNEWAESLVDAFSVVVLYNRGNAVLNLQFQFNNQVKPNAEIVSGGRLYNRTLALKPFMAAALDATSVAVLDFKESGVSTLPASSEPVIQGMLFKTDEGIQRCVLINLSGSIKHVDLAKYVFRSEPSTFHLEGYANGLADTETAKTVDASVEKSNISLPAYSVVQIFQ